MLSRRLFRKPLRLLLPVVVLGAVVLVPGVALADGDANPAEGLLSQVPTTTDGLTGTGTTGDATPVLPADTPVPCITPGLPPGCTPVGGGGTTPPPQLDPEQLRALLLQVGTGAGFSEDCVNGVFNDFLDIIDAVATGQDDLQQLLTDLVTAVQSGGSGFDQNTLTQSRLARALQNLADTLQAKCKPGAPGGTTTPPAGGAHYTPPSSPAYTAPAAATTSTTPPAAAPVAQPAGYLGYAPTGGDPEGDTNPVPLAAMGGVVLLSAVGATGCRLWTRGARSRG